MSAGEYCNREVIIITKSAPIREAVNLMRTHHVGDVIVVDNRDGSSVPLGILTDRDIVVEILAEDVDIDAVNVGDAMSYELLTVTEDTKLMDAIKLMKTRGVRRMPVVDGQGSLVGILTVDDILELINEQLADIVGLISKERSVERKHRQ